MASVLIAWVSDADIEAAGPNKILDSRIHRVVADEFYAHVILLGTQSKKAARQYRKWLAAEVGVPIELERVKLNSEFDLAEVQEVTIAALDGVRERIDEEEIEWSFLLGSESPIFDAVLIQLAQSRYAAELLHYSPRDGLRVLEMRPGLPPLDRKAEPTSLEVEPDLEKLPAASPITEELSRTARHLASLQVPVLIHGEPGTGRELLAESMHRVSARRDSTFAIVDCDVESAESLDRLLFGENGLLFSRCTLFLESVDALPPLIQARMTRALRDSKVQTRPVRARIFASTTYSPQELLTNGLIRAELVHLLAIGVIRVPSLHERGEEILYFAETILQSLSTEYNKTLSLANDAKDLLKVLKWPGNLRELQGTLRRVSLTADGEISAVQIRENLISPAQAIQIGDNFQIQTVLDDTARAFIRQALEQCDGNLSQTARLLGLSSYQTLTNWMKRLELNS
jgi:transcriptional regulator of acetoin/glycerol metabolism